MDVEYVNVKESKNLLRQLNTEVDGKKLSIAELKLCIIFTHNDKLYFILFRIIHMVKNIRNEFHYPKLVLSTVFF